MTLHGGVISATSEGFGAGSTFTVELPVVRALSNARSLLSPNPNLLKESLQDHNHSILMNRIVVKNVLVVDDAPLNRKMLCR